MAPTCTGIERSAAAFASGVPEGTGDDGFFGPASVTWRMSADLASPVAGLRSLLMQALHPLAMAAGPALSMGHLVRMKKSTTRFSKSRHTGGTPGPARRRRADPASEGDPP